MHAGQEPEPVTGAIMPPVFQTSTYVHPALGEPLEGPQGVYDYSRATNPTREALEAQVASLESGRHGISFSSGMAAIDAVLRLLSAGDHVVCEKNTYGGTYRLFTRILSRLGIDFSFVDTRDPDRVRDAVRAETRLLFVETPTNPLMRLCDLEAMVDIAGSADALLCVDNTFASPYNQRPLELGAGVVIHSTTKYLNGHSDLVGGIVVVEDDDLAEDLRFIRLSTGAIPGPMDAWLCLRGAKTLHLRMERHNGNGLAVARFLEGHPRVERVHYPGLDSHPQHSLAGRQMSGFGGMVSADLGSGDRARKLVEGTRIFALAESLGGIESLISVPALMTHASVPEEERLEMGITDGLVRLSVGVEDAVDLLADLEQALE